MDNTPETETKESHATESYDFLRSKLKNVPDESNDSENEKPQKQKKGGMWKIFLSIFIFVMLSAGGFFAFKYFKTSTSLSAHFQNEVTDSSLTTATTTSPEIPALPATSTVSFDPRTNLTIRSVIYSGEITGEGPYYHVVFVSDPVPPEGSKIVIWKGPCDLASNPNASSVRRMWTEKVSGKLYRWESDIFMQGMQACARIVDTENTVTYSNPVTITALPWNSVSFDSPYSVSWHGRAEYSLTGIGFRDTRESSSNSGGEEQDALRCFRIVVQHPRTRPV